MLITAPTRRVLLGLLLTLSAAASDELQGQNRPRHREIPGLDFGRAWKHKANIHAGPRLQSAAQAAPTLMRGGMVKGNLRLPVVIVNYTGENAYNYSPSDLHARMFGAPSSGVSVTQYYRQMSNDSLIISGEVAGPVLLPRQSPDYVGTRQGYFGTADNLPDFLNDVLQPSAGLFNWGLYDNDGPDGLPNSGDDDGRVDALVIVFAGEDGACSTVNNGRMWAHRWNLTGATGSAFTTSAKQPNGNPVLVDDYVAVPGNNCADINPSGMAPMGTLIHEIGHAFDLPDLYSTKPGAVSEGVGHWDLMGTGNWKSPEYPTAMGAWSRMQLGWLKVRDVTDLQDLVLAPVHSSREIVRIYSADKSEYVLLENRTATSGADAALPSEGMLIWHINPARVTETLSSNQVNYDVNNPGIVVVQADNRKDLEGGVNRGDAGDVWTGNAGDTSFHYQSAPAALKLADGSALGFRIDDIQYRSSDGAILMDVTNALERKALLEITTNEPGVRAQIGDSTYTLPYQGYWTIGSSASVQILNEEASGVRTAFVRWSDGGTQSPRTFSFSSTATQSLKAEVMQHLSLQITSNDASLGRVRTFVGTEEVNASQVVWARKGAPVRIWAEPTGDENRFLFWKGSGFGLTTAQAATLPADTVLVLKSPASLVGIFTPPLSGTSAVVDELLLMTNQLPAALREYLDAAGNQNGRLDLGDVPLALKSGVLVERNGTLEIVLPARNNTPKP